MKERARAADIYWHDDETKSAVSRIQSRLVHYITVDWAILAPGDLIEMIHIVRELMPDRDDLNMRPEIEIDFVNKLKTAAMHRILAAEVSHGHMIYANACYAVRACQAHLEILRWRRLEAEINHVLNREDRVRMPIDFEDSEGGGDDYIERENENVGEGEP